MKPFLFLLFPLLGLLPLHAEELPQMIQLTPDGTFRIIQESLRHPGSRWISKLNRLRPAKSISPVSPTLDSATRSQETVKAGGPIRDRKTICACCRPVHSDSEHSNSIFLTKQKTTGAAPSWSVAGTGNSPNRKFHSLCRKTTPERIISSQTGKILPEEKPY